MGKFQLQTQRIVFGQRNTEENKDRGSVFNLVFSLYI